MARHNNGCACSSVALTKGPHLTPGPKPGPRLRATFALKLQAVHVMLESAARPALLVHRGLRI